MQRNVGTAINTVRYVTFLDTVTVTVPITMDETVSSHTHAKYWKSTFSAVIIGIFLSIY